jgi:hypothetical protein
LGFVTLVALPLLLREAERFPDLTELYGKTLWITSLLMGRAFYVAGSPIMEYKGRVYCFCQESCCWTPSSSHHPLKSELEPSRALR